MLHSQQQPANDGGRSLDAIPVPLAKRQRLQEPAIAAPDQQAAAPPPVACAHEATAQLQVQVQTALSPLPDADAEGKSKALLTQQAGNTSSDASVEWLPQLPCGRGHAAEEGAQQASGAACLLPAISAGQQSRQMEQDPSSANAGSGLPAREQRLGPAAPRPQPPAQGSPANQPVPASECVAAVLAAAPTAEASCGERDEPAVAGGSPGAAGAKTGVAVEQGEPPAGAPPVPAPYEGAEQMAAADAAPPHAAEAGAAVTLAAGLAANQGSAAAGKADGAEAAPAHQAARAALEARLLGHQQAVAEGVAGAPSPQPGPAGFGDAQRLQQVPPQAAPAHGAQGGQEQLRACCHCGTQVTSLWRRDPVTGSHMCSACRTYLNTYAQLPPLGLCCARCGSAVRGPYKKAAWRRDEEVTGGDWYCSPCFFEARRQARLAEQAQRSCHHCGTRETCRWRRLPNGTWGCSCCCGFANSHRGVLPPQSATCLECGGSSPGDFKGASWQFHPLTGKAWVCRPCHNLIKSRAQFERRLRQRGSAAADCGSQPEEREQGGQPQQSQQPEMSHLSLEQQLQQGCPEPATSQPEPKAQPQPQRRRSLRHQQAREPAGQDLFCLLFAAAGQGSRSGLEGPPALTPELVCTFISLYEAQSPDKQHQQEARLRPLLAQGEHDSAAALMQGALRLASLETAVAGPSGLGGCASGGGQSANHGCSAPPHDPSLLQQQQQQQQQACNADEQGQGRQQVPAASTQQLAVAPSPQAQQAGQAAHRGEQQAQPAWPEQAAQAATLSPGCAHPPPPVPPSPQPQPEQQAQQQPQPERQPQQEQEQQQEQQPLLDLLLDAAEAPVPAAAGLSHELAAAFLSLPEQQQAAKEGLLRRLITAGRFRAAVTAMSATLQLAGVAVPATSSAAGG